MTRDSNAVSDASPVEDHTPMRAEPVVIPSPDKHEASHHKPVEVKRGNGKKKVKGKVMKIIRRTHLYTGLLLLPWVLLFGSSGFMFNHSDMFESSPPEVKVTLSPTQVNKTLGFAAVDPAQVAKQIVASLNQNVGDNATENSDSKPARYELVNPNEAHLRGQLTFEGQGPGQNHQFNLNLQTGQASITTVNDADKEEPDRSTPPFAGKHVAVESLPVNGLKEKVALAGQAMGVESQTDWTAGRGGPQVRFQLRDEQGRVWNVAYNIMNSELAARAEDEPPVTNIASIMTALHKQHDYPTETSGKTIWLIFGDMTALTMVFWGVSGLIMWWQLKPTRMVGLAGLLFMIVVAGFVFSGAIEEMYYGPPRTRSAPPVRAVVKPVAKTPINTDAARSIRPSRSEAESNQVDANGTPAEERPARRRRQRSSEDSPQTAPEAE